jgi:TonB family protein
VEICSTTDNFRNKQDNDKNLGQTMIAYYVAAAAAITGNNPGSDQPSYFLELLRPPLINTPPASRSSPAPVSNPGLWVTTNDYPAAALRELREGLVGFSLTVGPDGKVKSCDITSSSGSPDLDLTACDLITQRARFVPATNAKGVAQTGRYANRVRWQIPSKGQNAPRNVPIPKAGQVNLSFVVDENGQLSNCQISGSAIAEGAKTPCDAGVTFQPFYNAAGERVRIKVQTSQTVNITEENDQDLKPE